MGWSTVEWPPKNGSNIKPKPKLRKHQKKIIIYLTAIFLLAVVLGVGLLSDSNDLFAAKYINNYYQILCNKTDLLMNSLKSLW
jgi:hypothetical protein